MNGFVLVLDIYVFQGMARHYGVFYPMQTFSRQKRVSFEEIPCFIEGSGEEETDAIEALASQLSHRVYRLSSEARKYLHLSAVFACNFVNHCYAISAELLEKHGIPFDVMLPLIDETAAKVHQMLPKDAQTGPAVRYDENVIRAQSQLLKNNPLVKDIYDRMSMNIHRLSEEFNSFTNHKVPSSKFKVNKFKVNELSESFKDSPSSDSSQQDALLPHSPGHHHRYCSRDYDACHRTG